MEGHGIISFCVLLLVLSFVVNFRTFENESNTLTNPKFKARRNLKIAGGHFSIGTLIPDDDIIDTMSTDERDEQYWIYVNSLQVLCKRQMRFGSLRDGGKNVCLDKPYKPEGQCIVYSFGSNLQFDFEEEVKRHFDCEIHTFDPSTPVTSKGIPDKIHFHYVGLGAENKRNNLGWNMQTFSSMQSSLNHTKGAIDILKIDIENGEWSALPEMLESGSLRNVKQLCIEIYYDTKKSSEQLKILRHLYEAGFHIFMHEPNPVGKIKMKYPYGAMTKLNELSLINISWKK